MNSVEFSSWDLGSLYLTSFTDRPATYKAACHHSRYFGRLQLEHKAGTHCSHLARSHTRSVQKVSDLWSAKIQLFIWMSETLIPFKVVSLVMHTLLLPLLETFLESFLWNHVQPGCRVPHNVFS